MVSLSCYDDKKYLKTDTIGYGFINLLINHAKVISSSIDNLFNFWSKQNSYFINNIF